MNGRSTESIEKVLWPDAEIEHLTIDYDEIILKITESTQKSSTIRCRGYIGYCLVGFWDEVVVAEAKLFEGDELHRRSIDALAARYPAGLPESGNAERNKRDFSTLLIRLVDGAELKIVASEFCVD